MKTLIKTFFKTNLLIVTIILVFTNQVSAESSVWKIEKDNATVYLAGTIHLIRPSDYPLPQEFMQAYQASQILTFETDMDLLSSPQIAKEMQMSLTYADERTIQTEVSAETYSKLKSYAGSLGISLDLMRKTKPGMMMSVLMIYELKKMGVSQLGIDQHFLKMAQQDNKATLFFETPQQQINMLAEIGIGDEDKFYNNMLNELSTTQSLFLNILKFWRAGNNQQLDEIINQKMKLESPKMYQSILVDRNKNWMPQIEAYFKTQPVELILVGAAHLIGEDGLLKALQDKDYMVSQVKILSK